MFFPDFEFIDPPDPLKPFVSRFIHASENLDKPMTMQMKPTGRAYLTNSFSRRPADMVYRFGKHKVVHEGRWRIGGQLYKQDVEISVEKEFRILACELAPTALYRLFGVNGSMLTDNSFSLSEVAPHLVDLAKDYFVADERADKVTLFNEATAFFSTLAANARDEDALVEEAVAAILQENGAIRMADLCAKLDVHPKMLTRRFNTIVGVPPKFFAKLTQLNWAMGLLFLNDTEAISEIALKSGFCDQAHFTKTFSTFYQQSPTRFIESRHVELAMYFDEINHSGPFIAKPETV